MLNVLCLFRETMRHLKMRKQRFVLLLPFLLIRIEKTIRSLYTTYRVCGFIRAYTRTYS